MCRRLGVSICGKVKCALKRRNTPPGMHGQKGRKQLSGFASQLQEKQKVKFTYGIMERQLRKYVDQATKKSGNTGIFLQIMLEMRLDNVVYRLGFAESRAKARQMVTHGHVRVNSKKIDIPSYAVRVGDVVSIKEVKRESKMFDTVRQGLAAYQPPSWLSLDAGAWSGTVLGAPTPEELAMLFDAQPLIEYYSR